MVNHQWLRIDLNPIANKANIACNWDLNVIFIDMGVPTTSLIFGLNA
jgi:hypothetical protein